MFKYILVLASILHVIYGLSPQVKEDFIEKLTEIGEVCVPEVGASDGDVALLITHQAPQSHEGKCLIFCLYKRLHFLKEDGSADHEGYTKEMAPIKNDDPELYEKMTIVAKKCHESVKNDSDSCEYATNLSLCGAKEGKSMGIDEALME